jgi:hypothetical protein
MVRARVFARWPSGARESGRQVARLQERTRLVDRKPRQAWEQHAGIAVPEVAHKVRLDMSFRQDS